MNNIEILENKIQCFRHLQNTLDDDEKELFEEGIQQKEVEAIENLIQENKELKEKTNKAINMLEKHIQYCEQEAKGSLNNEVCNIALRFDKHLLQVLKGE